jgi:hypothetical protein
MSDLGEHDARFADNNWTPTYRGEPMRRRDFLIQSTAASLSIPALAAHSKAAELAPKLNSHSKACILLWMTGGAPTSLLWDVKRGNRQGVKPIDTDVPGVQVSEYLPKIAQVMRHLSLVRSMSTRESEVNRAAFYMRTGNVMNPRINHPAFGSVVSNELASKRPGLKLPGFVCIGGEPEGPGYLGNGHAAYVVQTNEDTSIAKLKSSDEQFQQRLRFLEELQNAAPKKNDGNLRKSYQQVQSRAANILDSNHIRALELDEETQDTVDLFGDNDFGRGLLKARRLVERAVPFVEVHFQRPWGIHHSEKRPVSMREMFANHMPMLDAGLSGLVTDLERRGMIDDVCIVCMGPYSLSPRHLEAGRSPSAWSAAWTNVIGGGGLRNGQAIGATDEKGVFCLPGQKQYLPGDIWATVAHAMGISHKLRYTVRNRPISIVGGGDPIRELI